MNRSRWSVPARIAAVIVVAAGTSVATAQATRGPEVPPERIVERLDERIVDMERALERMREIRAEVDNGLDARSAVRDLLEVQRALLEDSALREFMERRAERGRPGSAPFGERPGGRRGGPPTVDGASPEVLEYARENLPEVAAWVEELSDVDSPLARRMASRVRARVADLIATEEDDARLAGLKLEEFRAEIGVMRAARALTIDGGEAEEEGRETLRAALGRQFDANLAMRRYEVVRTAERVEDLEAEIARREAKKDSFLDDKVEEMAERFARRMTGERLRGGGGGSGFSGSRRERP